MKTAVCTLVVGDRFERLFHDYAFRSWQNYCRAHKYEIVIFRKLFANLGGKSVAWQKLFVLEQPELRGFDKVVWLDADIIIKSGSPPMCVPEGQLGYVQEAPFTGSVATWYNIFSLPPAPEIVQTGVLCLESGHQGILEQAMDYPDTVMYEMPALSWCISQSGVGYRLDRRFNALLGTLMLDYAPRWMVTTKLIKELFWHLQYRPLRRAVQEVCENNWFIHAAGAKRDLIKTSRCLAKLEEHNLSAKLNNSEIAAG